ncbi:hypothetical protein L6164_037479 [Bauhinia variegata]|uniref:Uncharacterized protein n=1 Tax=Bauhinia variegata TaxID=167791 RepID=A0ACB9KK77_BAUVA|nr:hypothetical protein L6164_037479 [Bauhinia variegata]
MAASFSANYQSQLNLRPAGALRSRKKCEKLGLLRVHSPRFIFKASVDSQSTIVIVIAVTLSAVSLFYFGYSRRKRNAKKILGCPTFASSLGSNVGNQAIQTQILDFQEFQRDNSLKEVGLLEESTEHNLVFVDKEAQLPFWRSSVVHEEVVMTKLQILLLSSFEPLTFAEGITELQVERSQDEVDSNAELLIIMDESKSTAASVHVENALRTVDKHAKEKMTLMLSAMMSVV